MLTIDQVCDRAIERNGLPSDRQLAMRIGVNATNISNWRTKRFWPSDDTMMRLCELAGIEPSEGLLWLNIWRSQGTARSTYEKMLSTLARTAAAVVLTIGGHAITLENQADAAPTLSANASHTIDYGKWLTWLRTYVARLRIATLAGHAMAT